ncbi:hypothetical protein NGM99_01275 [Mesorhizobium sp. RP14(2022)]|uniref:Antibiotic biosynthesis monooxygenase n=1 Tax=Mesorhizobium liriopis TaxID=2953882 RepID=A0ABT1C0Q1_9HYPH|nr:hypothetical protein [Mesorhizobium liriopis]MCO6048419.1 hypothetical protein [Mesorhizobium liriopis]
MPGPTSTIARIWRGRSAPERADEYERCHFEEGILPLREKALGVQTFRKNADGYSEFMTISYRAGEPSMASFSGGDPRAIDRLLRDEEFLLRLPAEVQATRLLGGHGQTG